MLTLLTPANPTQNYILRKCLNKQKKRLYHKFMIQPLFLLMLFTLQIFTTKLSVKTDVFPSSSAVV
jgi:hypothetical protein